MGKKQNRTTYDVTPEQFVQAWETSANADEVADKLKMPVPIVHARASNYRKAGIRLKHMPRKSGIGGLDVQKLNQMILELGSDSKKKR